MINIIIKQKDKLPVNITAKEGTYLLDAINESGLKNISIFGICDKQLSCHSCAVNILNKKDNLPIVSEEEKDVLSEIKHQKYNDSTRMSCQIKLNYELDGLVVEVFESEFFNENNDF